MTQSLVAPRAAAGATLILLVLAGCGRPGPVTEDPLEAFNREIHDLNIEIDRAAVRPAATAYAAALPDDFQIGIGNFARNADTPRVVVNQLLQGRVREAGVMSWRFLINSTWGVLGLWDAASTLDVPVYEADFGQTLHAWGVGEGAFVMLPLAGPSTVRDGTGAVVDLFINPLSYVLPTPERYVATAAGAGSFLSDRAQFRDTMDSVLYESADSYAQARLAYMQNRRFELGTAGAPGGGGDPLLDPYFDPYADAAGAGGDPTLDPYFDPYSTTEAADADPLSDPYFDPYAR